MKKLFLIFATLAALLACGCSKEYDDSALTGRVDRLENRVAALEELCRQMNTNIASLQALVNALQQNDCITAVTPITKEGKTVGYTITFAKGSPITIYHGKDGKDGQTPMIGVRQDSDGAYYWTIDDEWLTDDAGNRIKAEGRNDEDGTPGQDIITPQLKIEKGYWYISYDNGATWTNLGKVTGENGQDGESFFKGVDTTDSEFVVFTLADGTTIKLPTWYAFEQLKTLCNQMNANISSLQTIVTALQDNDYITSCTPLIENGKQIGYTIAFAKSGSIVIYHGQNGEDGANGSDDKDGHSPAIGAKTDTDGIIYWTLDGEWLTDESGNKIPVHGRDGANGSDGKDAITPQLRIMAGYWYISYGGVTWTPLGKATGENGKDGESFFQDVSQDEDYVHLTLSTGEKISIPKHHPLSISFTETEDIRVQANQTYSISYTIAGADDQTVVKALAQDGFHAVVKKNDNSTGTIEITTPSTILSSEVLVFVSDGKERTIMRSINFVEGVIVITTKSYPVGPDGETVEIDLSTNIDYTVEIPEADKEWISVKDIRTRAVMRDERITLEVAPNPTLTARYSEIHLVDALGVIADETILITQEAGSRLHVATAGTLESLIPTDKKDVIEELFLTGTLNKSDFDFIRTMTNLKLLSLWGLNDKTMPDGCLANSTIATVILPLELTEIPYQAFYQAGITSISIPGTVETIGPLAFAKCKSIRGDLYIPEATTSIGMGCFRESTFDGRLTLGKGLQKIGAYAFRQCANFTGDLIIPDNVTSLGEHGSYVFADCTGFNGKLVLGKNLKEIEPGAFYNCKNLTGDLTIPDTVERIHEYAFYNCGNTSSVTLGKNVKYIYDYAFGVDEDQWHHLDCYCKSSLPPTLEGSNVFGNKQHFGGILYVPMFATNIYKQPQRGWAAWFNSIEEMVF